MGWSFRRAVNLGPLRLNVSKSGLGYSVGTRGFRIGQDGKGRRYRAASIPSTGIFRRDYFLSATPKKPSLPQPPTQNPSTRRTSHVAPKPIASSLSAGRWTLYVGGAVLLYVFLRVIF
jgi:hypothetical protein